MKKIIIILMASLVLVLSCADSKEFNIDGKSVMVEPYGWADSEDLKRSDIVYRVSKGNVVLSVIFSETILVPILLTGWDLFEPVKLKDSE